MEENTQTKIGEEAFPTMQGFIRNLIITPRPGSDSMYKFQIRYLDAQDKIVEPNEWYSGFKQAPGQDGDYIHFSYKIKGIYNNVQEVLDIKLTHNEADDNDIGELQQAQLDMDEPKLNADLNGDNATTSNVLSPEGLTEPYKALLLNATIQLCTRRGTLTDEEIKAQYNRFLQIL